MAPAMGLKRSAAAATAGVQTVTLPATSVRDAVRVAVLEAAEASSTPARVPAPAVARDGVLCLEEVDGRRWSYVVDAPGASVKANPKGTASFGASFKAVPLQSPLPPVEVRPYASVGSVRFMNYCDLPWIWFWWRPDSMVLARLSHLLICHLMT
jgi:hypothetical protein